MYSHTDLESRVIVKLETTELKVRNMQYWDKLLTETYSIKDSQ